MSIAFPTLAIVAALIPGIVFINSYYSGKFARELAGLSPLAEIALYVVWAIPIDAFFLSRWMEADSNLSATTIAAIIAGKLEEPGVSRLIANLGPRQVWNLTVGYLQVVAAAVLIGVVLRRVVWTLRLDTLSLLGFLRMKPEWYYLLQGRLRGLPREVIPHADVLADHEKATRLYSGVVVGFEFTPTGALQEVVLVGAERFSTTTQPPSWKAIPGTRFIIPGPRIHSVNMRYRTIEPSADIALQFWRTVGRWLKAFVFEQP